MGYDKKNKRDDRSIRAFLKVFSEYSHEIKNNIMNRVFSHTISYKYQFQYLVLKLTDTHLNVDTNQPRQKTVSYT